MLSAGPLIEDPILDPVDKVIWLVLAQWAGRGRGMVPCPSFAEIGRQANVSSATTVQRALLILRARRWLTELKGVSAARTESAPSVRILHPTPLPLSDTVFLDGQFLAFLTSLKSHHHARVRTIASEALTSAETAESCQAVPRIHTANKSARARGARRPVNAFEFSGRILVELSNRGDRMSPPDPISEPPEKSGHPQNLRADRTVLTHCRCSNKKTTTTTTSASGRRASKSGGEPARLDGLVIPPRIDTEQYDLIARYLGGVPAAARQAVLDELAGRLAAERSGAGPVFDAVRYLNALCREVRQGAFEPNLGVAVRRERERRGEAQRAAGERAGEVPAKEIRRVAAESAIADLKAALGKPRS